LTKVDHVLENPFLVRIKFGRFEEHVYHRWIGAY